MTTPSNRFLDVPEKFLVAFSFAGEQRELIRAIADAVRQRLGPTTVFLDEWYEHYIAGEGGDLRLREIYESRAELVVVCVSERYGKKPWTKMEHSAVRAKVLRVSASNVPADEHRVLPIRVGDGDVPGISFNTIVPDVRARPPEQTAELIIKRLGLIVPVEPLDAPKEVKPAGWPEVANPFPHGLADRVTEWPTVQAILTANSNERVLVFRGDSGHSKSALLISGERYARSIGAATAYIDFRDQKMLVEANVIREISSRLGRAIPAFGQRAITDRWEFVNLLRQVRHPTLVLFDTYEKTPENGEVVEWIETTLLAEVDGCDSLRFIVAGQRAPKVDVFLWANRAVKIELSAIRDQAAWTEWARTLHPKMDEKHIEAAVLTFVGVPATVSGFLRTLSKQLPSDK